LDTVLAIVGVLYSIRRSEKNRDRHKHQAELEHVEAEKLREVDQMKSRFFANISHEFRTPLTLILGPIRKWRVETSRRDVSTKEMDNDFEMMERNAQRLLRLINQLLDLSKLEGGAMKLRASRGNIVPFVKGLASSFESSADVRRVAVSIHADRDEIEVCFDKDKMEKILTNLLSNAFKFTPEGGDVRVEIRNPQSAIQNHIEITIADTGIGIPSDELPRVFDRFYQVDSSQTREHEGSGIGLALTKELVELHHGTISVRSEVGKGTEFTVRLPLGREHLKDEEVVEGGERQPTTESLRIPLERDEVRHGKKDETSTDGRAISHPDQIVPPSRIPHESGILDSGTSSLESTPRNDGKPLVLVVEDNADVRAYMREYLVTDYDVQEAHDGAEGIEKAREIIPDLIISDVMMPKKDGYELCKALKLDEKTSHIPIILLTAKAGTENKIEGLETGADDYLTKPFDAKELLVRVKNLIDLRRKLRERFSVGQVLKPGDIAVISIDDAFLQKAMAVVEQRMGDEEFGVEQLRDELGMSRTQLHRKLTALTNQSAGDFIRYMRLQRAKQLLEQDAGNISEIAYQVGFNSVAYFTKCFREQFGVVPSEVRTPKA
jgi:signal transduction histidine kinase/DNA-binding response OmpR family regulator